MDEREWRALHAALGRLREVRRDIGDAHAGVATLHLEATIAALESHLNRTAARKAA